MISFDDLQYHFPDIWSVFLYSLICYWFPQVYFSFQLLYFSVLFFFHVWWASLWPWLQTLFQTDCSPLFHLVLFLRFCLILSFGIYFSTSSFCLTLCVCFYVLGMLATSPGLEGRGLTQKASWEAQMHNSTLSLDPSAPGYPHVGCKHPPFVTG